MATNWNQNPDWAPIELINKGFTIEFSDGFRAADQNKIVENIQYLFNHITAQHVYIGNVTTSTGNPGTQANVQVTSRAVADVGVYLDFVFTIPRGIDAGFGTPTAGATGLAAGATPVVTVSASGPSTAKVFDFQFKIPAGPVGQTGAQGPKGDTGPPGPPGVSVAAGMSVVVVTKANWVGNKLTIPHSIHLRGQTSSLIAITKPEISAGLYDTTYDSPTIADDGTITITSRAPWNGQVLVAGGLTAAQDAEARNTIDLHIANKSNPHTVTKAQVGLGSVDNLQQATKTEFNTHNTDNVRHITTSERTAWNGKTTAAEIDAKISTHNVSGTAHSDIRQSVAEARAIAEGRSRAKVFNTETEMNNWLAVPANVATLNVGDNLLIIQLNVPDRWWDGTQAQILETEKVDISGKANVTDLNNHVNNKSNPHTVTKSQVGLANVPNLDTTAAVNNQHTHTNKSTLDATSASFTTTLNTKLSGIESGAQVNVIETIKKNGVTLTPSSKAVDITTTEFPANTAVGSGDPGTAYRGQIPTSIFSATKLWFAQKGSESSGIAFDGDGIVMWSPGDKDLIAYFDEDSTSTTPLFKVNTTGMVYRNDGKRALYEGEVTVPTVGNGTITLQQGGVTKGSFTTNQTGNATINFDAGGGGGGATIRSATIVVGFTDDCDIKVTGTTDHQTFINNAIIALPAGGGKVILREGTYNITGNVKMNKQNTTFEGMGNSTILKRMANFSNGVLYVLSNFCIVKDLLINGNREVYTVATNDGINISGSNNTVTGTSITGISNSSSGIDISGSNNTVTGNTVTGNTVTGNSSKGIKISGSYNNTVTGNTYVGGGYGIDLLSGSYNNTVTGNTCNSNSYGINISSSYNNTVTGNTVTGNNVSGIRLINSSYSTVTGNTCNSNNSGININNSSYSTVTGNACNSNSSSGIDISGSNNTVTGNTCNSNSYGINISNSSNNNLIVGNQLYNNNLNALVNTGTDTLIRANKNGATNIES